MNTKVLQFEKNNLICKKIASKKRDNGDLLGSLSMLFSALKTDENDYAVMAEIASVYSDMGVLDQANQYWFNYLLKAPENERANAYVELAINYFYLDNLYATSYYFHKRFVIDGFMPQDTSDEAILSFFANDLRKKSAYGIAYPYERADYSRQIKSGRRAFGGGDFQSAIDVFLSIPKECMTEDAFGEYAISYLMLGKENDAIDVCKNSLSVNGENVTAYCNLSIIYNALDNQDKSDYYYKKALETRKFDKDEAYKLAGCSIEKRDYLTAQECLEKIISDKPFDPVMHFFNAICLCNIGDFEKGISEMETAFKICPNDEIYAFYIDYLKELKERKDKDRFLPIIVEKDYPKNVTGQYREILNKISLSSPKLETYLKDKAVIKSLFWGLDEKDEELAKKCALALGFSSDKKIEKALKDMLLKVDVSDQAKRLIIFTLILNDKMDGLNVIAGDILVEIKKGKLVFKADGDGMLYVTAFAYAMARLVFWRENDIEQLYFSANKVYKKFSSLSLDEELSANELAVIMLYNCQFERFATLDKICLLFNVEDKKIQKYVKILKGKKEEKND